MTYRGSLLPVLLVAVLAGLTFWLQRITEPTVGDRSGRGRHDPDFIVQGLKVKRFTTDGSLQHTLLATRMEHFPDDDTTTLAKPQILFHRTPPVRLSAESAWVSKDAVEVRLSGDVRFERKGVGTPDTLVATSRLTIFPDDETARGDEPVTITQGQSVINGTGLEVDNKTSTTRLLGRVKGLIHRKTGQTS